MAKTPDSAGPSEVWRNMSRQYWDAWAEATRKVFDADPAHGEAGALYGRWHEGLEQWSRMFGASQAGATQSEVVERLLGGARSYFSLLESLIAKDGQTDPHAWADALRESFNFPGADAALFDNPLARAMRELTGQGAKSFEQMMQALEPAMAEARALLQLPAFGYAREHQEHYQRMATAWLDYQRETNRYNVLIARASREAFESFEEKLAERGESGRPIDSVRGLYDLWVDAAEDAYAKVALSDEFREVYGALVNAQMRVRRGLQLEVERVATDLGMPTRSEIDSMGRRLHEVRREARSRAEQLSSMKDELDALREEVARLRQVRGGGGASRTSSGESSNRAPAKSSGKAPRKGRKSARKEKA